MTCNYQIEIINIIIFVGHLVCVTCNNFCYLLKLDENQLQYVEYFADMTGQTKIQEKELR